MQELRQDSIERRCFFAITFAPYTLDEIHAIIQKLQAHCASQKIRWIPLKNLHITLNFLGNVTEIKLSNLINKIAEDAKTLTAQTISLQKLSLFPSPQLPRLIVLEPSQTQFLAELVTLINKHLIHMDLPIDTRPYRPHLSLARLPTKIKFQLIPPH